jgi:hypothetical protein
MNSMSHRKTTVAAVVAGTFTAVAFPPAQADVVNLSWRGAFTLLNNSGTGYPYPGSDYMSGYYGNGDSSAGTFGTPTYPGNVNYAPSSWGPPYAAGPYPGGAMGTAHGWYGNRTPVSGNLMFDLSTGAGVGTINPFFFGGDIPGSGPGGHVADMQNFTFLTVDTVGTLVGTMLMSWNGGGHAISIVLDGSGLFQGLNDLLTGGPTSVISGVGALPATENTVFGAITKTSTGFTLPLGPSPIATRTTNAIGCEALTLATMVNAYTIVRNEANLALCDMSQDDGIGGSPMVSSALQGLNFNFDMTAIHNSTIVCTTCPPVPLPSAVWLFGSGLLGLIGLARRRWVADGSSPVHLPCRRDRG